jgi:DNA-directed RNA polymerase specialized sigma24 family protein
MAFDPRLSDESDAALMSELYRWHAGAVYRFVRLTTGSEAETADVLQETFVAVLERRGCYDAARGSCIVYLCGVAPPGLSAVRQAD